MFYVGSEVVVIGSNIKRKSGPRVGSVGNLLEVTHSLNYRGHNVSSASICFTRYGYEKTVRLEIKKVYIHNFINITNLFKNKKDFRKTINRFIRQTKNTTPLTGPLVVLAPTGNFIPLHSVDSNIKLVVPYIISNLNNLAIFTVLKSIVYDDSGLYLTLKTSVSQSTIQLIHTLISQKLSRVTNKLEEQLIKDTKFIKEFIFLINTVKALIIRNKPTEDHLPPGVADNKSYRREQLLGSMFMNHCYNDEKKLCIGDVDSVTTVENLKKEIIKKGKSVYTAY